MKIVELFLDDNEESGIEAISIVENPAIESDFIALKSDEIKLAEVDKEKKILMGALLIPNKPIYRKTDGEEYYIYFSRETVLKASQRYLMNGYQGNSTLEHSRNLEGLTLVESWIVEDEVHDKSRKYGLNAPIGTWMGTMKVNNENIWNDFVKEGKVKGFSIEGFFADKIETSKMNKEQKSDLLLSKITSILKGKRIELDLFDDLKENSNKLSKALKDADSSWRNYQDYLTGADKPFKKMYEAYDRLDSIERLAKGTLNKFEKAGKELGLDVTLNPYFKDLSSNIDEAKNIFSVINSFEDPAKFQ